MSQFSELDSFVRVVRTGSITATAEQLGTAKSAVSKRLNDLETRLGVTLLTRTTRRMTLTDAGRRFLERAEYILAQLADAEAEASGAGEHLTGTLRLSAPVSFGRLRLQEVVLTFARTYPSVALEIELADRQVDLIQDGFDLALRIAELGDNRLVARPITRIRHAVAASPKLLRTYGTPHTPEELAALPGLAYTNTRHTTLSYTTPEGRSGSVRLNNALRANNGELILQAACAGLGVAMLPTFILSDAICHGDLTPLLIDYQWLTLNAYAVYPQTRHLSPRVRAFIDLLSKHFDPEVPFWDAPLNDLCANQGVG